MTAFSTWVIFKTYPRLLNRYLKYILRFLGGFFLLVLILYIILSLYVSANKEALIKKASAQIGTVLGGTVTINDLSVSVFNNFPYLAIGLTKIDVRDSLFARHGHPFFSADKIFVRLNPIKLLLARLSINKLEIESGSLYLFTDSSGYSNDYLLKGKTQPVGGEKKSATQDILDKIKVTRFAVTLDDQSKRKLFDFYINSLDVKTKNSDSGYALQVKQSILVKNLAFNLDIGSYLTGQLLEGNYSLEYSPAKKVLQFDSIPLSISKQPFRFTGTFSFGNIQRFALRVNTKNLLVEYAKTLLTKKTATGISLVSVKSPIDVTATLDGSLAGGNPLVVAKWITQKNSITTPLLNFDNCSFSGLYTNEVVKEAARDDANSKVEVYQFRGDWQGLTMTSDKIVINNLTTPIVTADMKSQFSLSQLNSVLQTEALSLTGGSGSMRINYRGPVDHITPQNASLDGVLRIRDGNILMQASQSNLKKCNAAIRFRNADIIIDSLTCKIQNNTVRFNGEAKNALALLGDSPGSIALTLNASAPVLNIEHLSSIVSRKFPTKTKKQPKTGSLAKTVQQIDNLLSNGNVAVNLTADKLVFQRFEARKATVAIAIDANSWLLKKASLLHGSGSITATGKVMEQGNNRFGLRATLDMKNVDAQKVWYEFENFGIPALSYKNIKGILSANATISLLLDKSGNFDMNTMDGEADFSVKQGALINFKPIQEIQTVAFKSRDFTDISFAEIKDKISFKKGEIKINRMEINSTVLSLFVEGVYSMAGNTDISIQVPLSNLKKRDKNFKPENAGTDRGGGMSIFLRAKTGDDGMVKIKYDPFKRFRKGATDAPDRKKN